MKQEVGLTEFLKVKIKKFFAMRSGVNSASDKLYKPTIPVASYVVEKPSNYIYMNGQKMAETVGEDVFIENGSILPSYSSQTRYRSSAEIDMLTKIMVSHGVSAKEASKRLTEAFRNV